MARTAISRAVWILLVIAAAGAGFALGQRQSHQSMNASLQVEAAGNLSRRIETLSLLRIGDAPGAINRLESEADALAVSIANKPGADQRVLASMKTYLSVAPPGPIGTRRFRPHWKECLCLSLVSVRQR